MPLFSHYHHPLLPGGVGVQLADDLPGTGSKPANTPDLTKCGQPVTTRYLTHRKPTVGAGLLANALDQSLSRYLTHSIRQRAGSYK
jgi:hypothetical protein